MGKYDDYDWDVKASAQPAKKYDQYDFEVPEPKQGKEPGWVGYVDTLGRSLANGLTFGLADKFVGAITGKDEAALSAQRKEEHPYVSTAGKVAGNIAPGMAISKALTAIPGLASASIPSIIANQAATGGIQSTAEQAIAKGSVDPVEVGIDAGLSGAVAGPVAAIARAISPSAAVRASGSDLTDTQRRAAADFAENAKRNGIPLTIPESVRAVAPGNSSGVDTIMQKTADAYSGSRAIRDFQGSRTPQVQAAGERLAGELKNGTRGYQTQDAAKVAIEYAEKLVKNSADPYYKAAMPQRVPATPWGPAVSEAEKQLSRDPLKMGEIMRELGLPPNTPFAQVRDTVAFQDRVSKQLQTGANAFYKNDPYRSSILVDAKDKVLTAAEAASPDYKIGRSITEKGMEQLVDPLNAGPLGTIAKSAKGSTHGEALFGRGVNTDVTRDEAIDAAKRLGPGISQGVLGNRVQGAVSNDPLGWGRKAIPTEQGMDVAAVAAGPKADRVRDTLMAARSVDSNLPPIPSLQRSGALETVYHGLRGLGTGRQARYLTDTDNIANLGKIGDIQRFFQTGATAAVTTSPVVPDFVNEITVNARKRRR